MSHHCSGPNIGFPRGDALDFSNPERRRLYGWKSSRCLHSRPAERLNWSGLPVVHVRPTIFLEGFFTADSVRESNQIRLPFGDGKTSPVAVEDIARVVAALLADPRPHVGKIYHLTGPQSENMQFFAREYSKALGRMITFADIPVEMWRDGLLQRGLPVHLVNWWRCGGRISTCPTVC